jgi:CBS domain containing-hemolysin-like protein
LDDQDYLAIAIILACTMLNFCLSLAETALVTMSRTRLQHRHQDGSDAEEDRDGAAESKRWLLTEPTRVVATVRIGLTIFSFTALGVAIALLGPDLASWLRRIGVAHGARLSTALLVVVIALLSMVVGEIVPRAVALRYPDRVASLVASPTRWFERLARPLVAAVIGLSNLIVRPFGLTASFQAPVITEEELRTILEASEKEGVIQEEEKEMLHNVISFGDTPVHKVMTPRVHVKAIDVDQPLEKLINLIVDHGHSRIPVYDSTIDDIIGIIHAKDLLPHLRSGSKIHDLRPLLREPFFVPEQMRTDELLEHMRRSNTQLAIVQDEYGGTAGLVTVEDLLEEIVGEIQDEYDVEQPMIERDEDGAALADARIAIDDVNEELNLSLPTVDFDTIGGLVFGLFGSPPAVGDTIDTVDGEDDDRIVRFTVTKADGRRLQQIKIEIGSSERQEAKPEPDERAAETAVGK